MNSNTVKFQGFRIEGFLRKFVNKVKIFQKSLHPKRYFVIDFTIASIIIANEKPTEKQMDELEVQKDMIVMPFRDILDCYPP